MTQPPVSPPPARSSRTRTMVGVHAFLTTPTASEKSSVTGIVVGSLLALSGLALGGLVVYGLVLRGTQLSTVVVIALLALAAALVLGGLNAGWPEKTQAGIAVLEGVGKDIVGMLPLGRRPGS